MSYHYNISFCPKCKKFTKQELIQMENVPLEVKTYICLCCEAVIVDNMHLLWEHCKRKYEGK